MKNTYRTLLFGKLNFSYGTLGHYNSSRARYFFFLWNVTFPVWNIVQLCYGTLNSSYGTIHSSYGTLHSSFWNITSLIWNITISILKYEKKTASRLLYILQRYKLPKMGLLHKRHWFIFNDSFLRRNKTNYERIERNIYCLYTNRCTPNVSYFFQNELLYTFSINSPF